MTTSCRPDDRRRYCPKMIDPARAAESVVFDQQSDGAARTVGERLASGFGYHGVRAARMLSTATVVSSADLELGDAAVGELISYCVREAFSSILESSAPMPESRWFDLSRDVVAARQRVTSIGDPDLDEPLRALLGAVDRLGAFHATEASKSEAQLLGLLRSRLGADAMRLPPDPVSEFVALRRRASKRLHGSVTAADGRLLLVDALRLLDRMFPEPTERLSKLEALAAVEDVTADELDRLLELAVSPHHLAFFFEQASSTRWLELAVDAGHMLPGQMPTWPPIAMFRRLGKTRSAELAAILKSIDRITAPSPMKGFYMAQAASELGRAGHDFLVRLLRKEPESGSVRAFVRNAVDAVPDSDPFLEAVAPWLLGSPPPYDSGWFLTRFVDGASTPNVLVRLQLAIDTISAETADKAEQKLADLSHSTVHGVKPSRDEVSQALAAIDRLLHKAVALQTPTVDVLELIDGLTPRLSAAFRAVALAHGEDVSSDRVLAELATSVSSRNPQGDDLALIARWTAAGQGDPEGKVAVALGVPPPAPDIEAQLANGSLGDAVLRGWLWASILPPEATPTWAGTLELIASAYGRVSPASFRSPPALVGRFRSDSPISADDLSAMSILEAADAIRDWRPSGGTFEPSVAELASALGTAIDEHPDEWASDVLTVVHRLRHPTYIMRLFDRLAKAAGQITQHAGAAVDAVALVAGAPWPVESLGDVWDAETNWDGSIREGMALIGALAEHDADFGAHAPEAWRTAVKVACSRVSNLSWRPGALDDFLTSAIARPQTTALDAALHLMGRESDLGHPIPDVLLDLLDRSLRLTGADGAHHRAILATRLDFLHAIAPEWLAEHEDLLLGPSCPAELADATVDLALKWSRSTRWLLIHHQTAVLRAVFRETDNALERVIAAMCSDLPGYDPMRIFDRLASTGDEWVSRSGFSLAQVLDGAPVDHPHVVAGTRFWRVVVERAKRPAQLSGFGYLSDLTCIDQQTWLELMRVTCTKAGGRVEFPTSVADRVATGPFTDDAIEILLSLMRGAEEPWQLGHAAEVGLGQLRSADRPWSAAATNLRDALLEYGAIEARDL